MFVHCPSGQYVFHFLTQELLALLTELIHSHLLTYIRHQSDRTCQIIVHQIRHSFMHVWKVWTVEPPYDTVCYVISPRVHHWWVSDYQFNSLSAFSATHEGPFQSCNHNLIHWSSLLVITNILVELSWAWQWQVKYIDQTMNSQRALHIPRPYRRATECLLWVFWRKVIML